MKSECFGRAFQFVMVNHHFWCEYKFFYNIFLYDRGKNVDLSDKNKTQKIMVTLLPCDSLQHIDFVFKQCVLIFSYTSTLTVAG